jgi:hypothetical protein
MAKQSIYKQKGYLNDNVTGKQVQQAKSATNKSVKEENTSLSFCIKQVLKHDQSFLTSFKGYKKSDIVPANLLPLLTEKEAKSGKFTAWLVMNLISRYYKASVAVPVKVAA